MLIERWALISYQDYMCYAYRAEGPGLVPGLLHVVALLTLAGHISRARFTVSAAYLAIDSVLLKSLSNNTEYCE